jgi:hypothetical protein
MPDRCEIEVAGLPVLTGCPANDELFFVNNAAQGLGEFGYGQRTWLQILNCIILEFGNPYLPKFFQFKTVGDELTYTITPPTDYKVVDDSVNISLDGSELVRYDDDTSADERIMYDVSYEVNGTANINFYNAGAPIPAGLVMIIKYGIDKII